MDSLGAQDTVNILLMDPDLTTCFVTFSKDIAEAKRFLNQLKPGLGRADVNLANAAAARLIGPTARRGRKSITSPILRGRSGPTRISQMLPPAARLFFVDVGTGQAATTAPSWTPGPRKRKCWPATPCRWKSPSAISARDPLAGRVTVTLDKKFSFDQEISMAPWSEEKVTVPVAVGGPGMHLCEVRLPPDALEYDNHFFLTLPVLEKEEVLIVTDAAEDRRNSAYFLKTALNPFANEGGSLLPRVISSAELTPARLAGVQKAFFTQVGRLTPEACDAAAKFLFRGGGLVYFLDGPADAENLAALERITGPNSMPLRLSRRNIATNVTAGAQQIARGDFKSPYLKLFQGATRQDLALLEFYDYYQAGATSAGGVLLEYGDGSPAMASLHHGLGTLLAAEFFRGRVFQQPGAPADFSGVDAGFGQSVSTSEPPPCVPHHRRNVADGNLARRNARRPGQPRRSAPSRPSAN